MKRRKNNEKIHIYIGSGGEELALEFESEYDAGIVHPICFSLTDFSGEKACIHIPDQD